VTVRLITADVMEGLTQLPDESVHMVCTSPPYFGLRSYLPDGHPDKRSEIGLEPTPDAYVARMVEVFREVRRVLRNDGTVWLNLGDSYAAGGHGGGGSFMRMRGGDGSEASGAWAHRQDKKGWRAPPPGLKPKDLIGIPWSVAFALRADGWWLRQDIIWSKKNCMPESVTDRCTKSHEYVFLLAKSKTYFYDAKAIEEAVTNEGKIVTLGDESFSRGLARGANVKASGNGCADSYVVPSGRNKRSVWTIASHAFPDAHFATMPPDLAEICINAGCPKGGTVLDPFAGAGTTLLVADRLQKNAIGIELSQVYSVMVQRRLGKDRGGLLDLMEMTALED